MKIFIKLLLTALIVLGTAFFPELLAAQSKAKAAESKLSNAPGTPAQHGRRTLFHVLEYYRPGMTDAAVIQSAIDAAITSGGHADVVLENKTYHIDQTIMINRTSDITLDGNGARLVMTRYIMAINVNDCVRTRLTNMTFDYDPLPFSQGEIVKVDPQAMTWEIKIDAGFPWDGAFLEMVRKGGAMALQLMDVRQRMVKEGSYDPSISKVEVVGDRLLRMTGKNRLFVDKLTTGDVLAIAPWALFGNPKVIAENPKKYAAFYTIYHWQHSVIHMVNTEACQTDHLTFYTGPAALYEFAGKGGNHHFNNTVCAGPRPEGAAHDRQMTMVFDVFESVSTEKGPLVEDWFIERSGDDAIVLFGMFNKIVDSPGSGILLVTPVFRNVLAEGDNVEIRNSDDSVKGVARVTRLRSVNRPELADMNRKVHEQCTHPFPWTPETFLELTLDKDIPSQPGDRIIALNRRCQGTVIRNNHIRGIRANGMRINGADVLIENNDIEHTTMSGIKLSLDRENVLWAAPCENIVIRGNRIKSTGLLPIRDSAAVGMNAGIQQMLIGKGNNNRRFFSPNISARNITIENNLIENSAQYGILCANASQVVIRNNVIRDANLMEPRTNALGFKPESAIQVAASDHVTIGNNTITPGKYGKTEVGEFESSAVKITPLPTSGPSRNQKGKMAPATKQQTVLPSKTNLEAFSELKFGMFIHWGLYAIPAGEWKGNHNRSLGEWIMKNQKIPVAEYAALANQFNPVKFNADEWAKLAQDAGMKYMVITSKHHDGFAMFHSKASPYNIVDATPFKRDPMAELSKATAKRDIKFGFYYSQSQDWYEPNAAGNTWDFPEKRDPLPYLEKKVFPQVEELLTNYGKIALVWFDTPMLLTKEQVVDLKKLVKKYQPNCLVNDRIGYEQGDYFQMGDNCTPPLVYDWNVWEVPATLNDTWGYKKNDHNWKNPHDLIYKLADIVSKGGNYLLNVGPDARGVIPVECQDILRTMGKWLSENGDAIYGTTKSPLFMPGTSWKCTVKPGKMFIHVFHSSSGEVWFRGLESKITKAYLLKNGEKINYSQKGNEVTLAIDKSQLDEFNTVLVLELGDQVPVITAGFRYNDPQQEYSLFGVEARILGDEMKFLREQNAMTGFKKTLSFPPNELWWFHYPYKTVKCKVSVEYSCDDSIAGSPFSIVKDYDPYNGVKAASSFVNEELKGTIQGTGGKYKVFDVGEINLYEKNLNRIMFKLIEDYRSSGIRFRRVILSPLL